MSQNLKKLCRRLKEAESASSGPGSTSGYSGETNNDSANTLWLIIFALAAGYMFFNSSQAAPRIGGGGRGLGRVGGERLGSGNVSGGASTGQRGGDEAAREAREARLRRFQGAD